MTEKIVTTDCSRTKRTCPNSMASASEIVITTGAATSETSTGVDYPIIIESDGKQVWYDDSDPSVKFEYVDLWSSTYTWGCNDGSCFPEEGDIVVVSDGQHLVLDQDTPVLKALVVMGGTFEIDPEIQSEKVTLSAEYIIVVQGGWFKVGSEQNHFPCDKKVEIVLYGHRRSIRLPIFDSKVLAIYDGKLDLHGCPKDVTWHLLKNTVEIGDTSLQMSVPVENNWFPGEEIVIASTGFRKDQGQSEKVKIVSVSGSVVNFEPPLNYRHHAVSSNWESSFGEIRNFDQRAEVGVLTRNIKVRGNTHPEWNDMVPECEAGVAVGLRETQTCFRGQFGAEIETDQFGSQVMLGKYAEYGKIQFIEVTHGGQAFGLGRYPLHFHLAGDQPNSYVRGCGIHKTFNRALTIHATNDLLVEHNVVYNVMGQTIFIEDGNEVRNRIQYNVVIFTRPSSSLLNVDQTPTSYWITNPKNYVDHNHAAAGTHFGYWLNPPANPTGPSFTTEYCPINEQLLSFKNNTAHTFGVYGLWVFIDVQSTITGECWDQLPGGSKNESNWGNYMLEDFFAWGCERGAEYTLGGGMSINRFMAANNETGVIQSYKPTNKPLYHVWSALSHLIICQDFTNLSSIPAAPLILIMS